VKHRHRPPGSRVCCPSPLLFTFPIFGESFGSKQWLFCEQTGVFSVPRALIRYNYRRIWHVRRLNFLAVNLSHAHPTLLSAKRLGPTAGLSPNGSSQLAQAQHCPASSPRIQWTSRYSTPGDFPIHDLCQSPCTRHRCKLDLTSHLTWHRHQLTAWSQSSHNTVLSHLVLGRGREQLGKILVVWGDRNSKRCIDIRVPEVLLG